VSVVARRLVVRGVVQGVNFRSWVRSRAEPRGLAGWAANQDDGSVEVWLQGDPEAVRSVEGQIAQGPSHARVEAVEATDADPRDALSGFDRR
jgi:acylphosphatase